VLVSYLYSCSSGWPQWGCVLHLRRCNQPANRQAYASCDLPAAGRLLKQSAISATRGAAQPRRCSASARLGGCSQRPGLSDGGGSPLGRMELESTASFRFLPLADYVHSIARFDASCIPYSRSHWLQTRTLNHETPLFRDQIDPLHSSAHILYRAWNTIEASVTSKVSSSATQSLQINH